MAYYGLAVGILILAWVVADVLRGAVGYQFGHTWHRSRESVPFWFYIIAHVLFGAALVGGALFAIARGST